MIHAENEIAILTRIVFPLECFFNHSL